MTAQAEVSAVYEHHAGWSLSDDVWLTSPSHDPPLSRGDRVLAAARVKPGDQRRGLAARLEIQQITRVVPGTNARTAADELFDRALRQSDVQRAALVRGMAIGDDSA
ncbi:hypothetical protein RZS08_32395, partial [Arthrospira platensis SPKY1]|nr:hypothetical protein [Arthrospira platensis SPKY1]